jgi:hypothetical protein
VVSTLDVGLDEVGEVVDLAKEHNPAIVSCVMMGNLLEGVVALGGGGGWEVLFGVVF